MKDYFWIGRHRGSVDRRTLEKSIEVAGAAIVGQEYGGVYLVSYPRVYVEAVLTLVVRCSYVVLTDRVFIPRRS